MKERLIAFLSYLGIGQLKFEEKVGLSRGFVNKVGDSITLNTAKKIIAAYPELDKDWLISGDGEMLKTNTQENNVSTNGGIVGIQGNGHQITNNDIAGIIELQKGYQDMIKKSQEQIDKLIEIIKNYESWKKE
ncbi:hypothetical protein Barb6_01996 [Bacteroidales bacterium Barb6]|nr:hypothetical protein Barb6_01996 [Bacteroidales bacterium Barb6]